MPQTKPPRVLVKTWLDIYYSREIPRHFEAQNEARLSLLTYFGSPYEAEMYLFQLEHP